MIGRVRSEELDIGAQDRRGGTVIHPGLGVLSGKNRNHYLKLPVDNSKG